MNVSVLAGMVSTVLFAVSYLPMLLKALHTRDLDSYSLGYLALSNAANASAAATNCDFRSGSRLKL